MDRSAVVCRQFPNQSRNVRKKLNAYFPVLKKVVQVWFSQLKSTNSSLELFAALHKAGTL
jgi:hypothetical protein